MVRGNTRTIWKEELTHAEYRYDSCNRTSVHTETGTRAGRAGSVWHGLSGSGIDHCSGRGCWCAAGLDDPGDTSAGHLDHIRGGGRAEQQRTYSNIHWHRLSTPSPGAAG